MFCRRWKLIMVHATTTSVVHGSVLRPRESNWNCRLSHCRFQTHTQTHTRRHVELYIRPGRMSQMRTFNLHILCALIKVAARVSPLRMSRARHLQCEAFNANNPPAHVFKQCRVLCISTQTHTRTPHLNQYNPDVWASACSRRLYTAYVSGQRARPWALLRGSCLHRIVWRLSTSVMSICAAKRTRARQAADPTDQPIYTYARTHTHMRRYYIRCAQHTHTHTRTALTRVLSFGIN